MQDLDQLQLWLRLAGASASPLLARAKVPDDWYGAGTASPAATTGKRRAPVRRRPAAWPPPRRPAGCRPATSRSTSAATPSASTCARPARFRSARVYSRALARGRVAGRGSGSERASCSRSTWPTRSSEVPRRHRDLLRIRRRLRPVDDALGRELLPERRRLRRPHAAPRDGRDPQVAAVRRHAAVDLAKGQVRVENGYDFTNLQEIVAGRWQVRADDKVLGEGALPRARRGAAPGEDARAPAARDQPRAGRRVLARPRVRAEEATRRGRRPATSSPTTSTLPCCSRIRAGLRSAPPDCPSSP